MSSEIEAPLTVECNRCHERKPHTFEFFRPRRERYGALRHTCRLCMRRNDADVKRRRRSTEVKFRSVARRTPRDDTYVPGKKPCSECNDLPWRVLGERQGNICDECGLEYAEEAPPELRLRRFDRVG